MENNFTNFFDINRIEENLKNARSRYHSLLEAIQKQSGKLFYFYLCETVMWIDNTNEWFF
ncbi:hypothetical protein A0U40_17645 [[Bacillus] sp. KCTC 13219]|nr:hypothetical protein A0U40_17645 [[Bacillus] sp. KCTC 13219]